MPSLLIRIVSRQFDWSLSLSLDPHAFNIHSLVVLSEESSRRKSKNLKKILEQVKLVWLVFFKMYICQEVYYFYFMFIVKMSEHTRHARSAFS